MALRSAIGLPTDRALFGSRLQRGARTPALLRSHARALWHAARSIV